MASSRQYHIILVICSFCVQQLVSQSGQGLKFKPRILSKIRLPQPLAQRQSLLDNEEANGVNPDFFNGQNRLLQQLPSRSDNRNMIMDTQAFTRPKPRCSKRIRIANGVSKFRDKGSFVRYACSHGFTLLGATIAVCLRDQWSEPPPICVRPGCRRLVINNGFARLSYSGAVADFLCKTDYQLEGSRVTYCDGNRWNDTEPVCTSIHPLTTSTEVWEWPQPPTEELETIESESQLSPDEHAESWDYNNPNASSTPTSTGTISEDNSLSPSTTPTSSNVSPVMEKVTSHAPIHPTTITEKSTIRQSTTTILPIIATMMRVTALPSTTRSSTTASVTTESPLILPVKTSMKREVSTSTSTTFTSTTITTTTPTPEVTEAKIDPKTEIISLSDGTTSTESWEPFPDNTFDKFDQELEAGAPYDTKGGEDAIPEFIQPISPHKLDDDADHKFYKKWAHISIVGGIVLVVLGGTSLVGGIGTYCWRKNIGIARANAHDIDGRTLSASDANEDFMWVDSRDQRMSRL